MGRTAARIATALALALTARRLPLLALAPGRGQEVVRLMRREVAAPGRAPVLEAGPVRPRRDLLHQRVCLLEALPLAHQVQVLEREAGRPAPAPSLPPVPCQQLYRRKNPEYGGNDGRNNTRVLESVTRVIRDYQ